MDDIESFIRGMPKVELHVHLEGSVRPETFLNLAKHHRVALPAETIEGLREWYVFRDFSHFIEIYMAISNCLRTPGDIETLTREFLIGQADQNIVYSEVTFTPYNQLLNCRLGMHEQLDAVNRARRWGEQELGVRIGMIVDIPRERSTDAAMGIAQFVIERYGDGIIALGLGGPEKGNPASKFRQAFEVVRGAGIPCVVHAGETDGPSGIWDAIETAKPRRIGHGVRCIEDPELMAYLKETQLPLEVCPTSNICLKVYPSLEKHSLPDLLDYGLNVTLNSDDPPLFNTTLTREYSACARQFAWDRKFLVHLVLNALNVSLLPDSEKQALRKNLLEDFSKLGFSAESPYHELLFSYGTLQLESVQMATFGRQLAGRSDALPGFELVSLKIEDPGVVAVSGKAIHTMARFTGRASDIISGTVFDVTPEEIQNADEYEVAAVKRVAIVLQSGIRAWVYVDARYAPSDV